MKSAFFTHCSDDWYEPVGCYKLEQSLRRVHPEVPFIRFGTAEIDEQLRINPDLHWDVMIPFWGKLLAAEFELLVHLDADSIVTGRLDEVLSGDYEIAGVRNNDDLGAVRYSCPGVPAESYLNCGLVASTRKEFWDEWHAANLSEAKHFPLAEQDVFNRIAHSSRYDLKILDLPGRHSYYGVAANPMYWQKIDVIGDQLYLDGRQVKVLHQAGGHVLPKLQICDQFKTDVARWLLSHTNSPCVLDAAGRYRGLGHDLIVRALLDKQNHLKEVIQSFENSKLRSRLGPLGVVLDVGAHVGIFSAFINPLASRIIACEPCAEHRHALRKTISHLELANVEVCPCAVWISNGETEFFLSDTNTTMHSLVRSPFHKARPTRVSCITLAELLRLHHIDRVSLLKLDIEGGELQLITDDSFSGIVSRVQNIWVECHAISHLGLTPHDVSNTLGRRLSQLGFAVEVFETELFASSKYG